MGGGKSAQNRRSVIRHALAKILEAAIQVWRIELVVACIVRRGILTPQKRPTVRLEACGAGRTVPPLPNQKMCRIMMNKSRTSRVAGMRS